MSLMCEVQIDTTLASTIADEIRGITKVGNGGGDGRDRRWSSSPNRVSVRSKYYGWSVWIRSRDGLYPSLSVLVCIRGIRSSTPYSAAEEAVQSKRT
jgi:hypothetical protein